MDSGRDISSQFIPRYEKSYGDNFKFKKTNGQESPIYLMDS